MQELGVSGRTKCVSRHAGRCAGLRWERYSLEAAADPIWLQDTRKSCWPMSETAVDAQVGLRFTRVNGTALPAGGTRLSRAAFSDVNVGLYLPTFNYLASRIRSEPERSLGLEAGLRWGGRSCEARWRPMTTFRDLSIRANSA